MYADKIFRGTNPLGLGIPQSMLLLAEEVSKSGLPMSPNGPKLTCRTVKRMSDVEGEADIKS